MASHTSALLRQGDRASVRDESLYGAFISYSHAADTRLASALRTALQRFAKRWVRLRAIRVFRDVSSLPINADLGGAIRHALDQSAYFVWLASPEAAASKYVLDEIQYWLARAVTEDFRPDEHFLIVRSNGEIVWDRAAGDFDWKQTTALSDALRGTFTKEPLHIDLTWTRD